MLNILNAPSLRAFFAQQSIKGSWIAAPYKKHKARNDGAYNDGGV